MLGSLGLAAGSAAWKAGHAVVRSGALTFTDPDDESQRALIERYAAERAREYMRQIVAAEGLTQAEGVRIFAVFQRVFVRGVIDQALDGGALFGGR